MAITNHERVGKALEILKSGLGPFVERETRNVYKIAPPPRRNVTWATIASTKRSRFRNGTRC